MRNVIVIDSCLLLLLIVGITSPKYIARHTRLHPVYTEDDFDLLVQLLEDSDEIIVSPHTLAETSNLLKDIAGRTAQLELYSTMRYIIDHYQECFTESARGAALEEFVTHRLKNCSLGLADCILLELTAPTAEGVSPQLLTVDLDLAIAAEMRGHRIVNFNELRNL